MKTKTLINLACALSVVLFFVAGVSAQKKFVWNGTWTTFDDDNSLTLKIRKLPGGRFAFSFDIKNGGNKGKVEGVGGFDRGFGGYMNPPGSKRSELTKPCIIGFTPRGEKLIISHTPECGKKENINLTFAGEYSKDSKTAKKKSIFEKTSLPTIDLEEQLKNLTGNDYDLFQTAMSEEQMPDEDNNLLAKRYNECLKMNCVWDRAFMVHYDKELKYAAVFFKNYEGKLLVYYYSNLHKDFLGIPTDITNWTNELKRKFGEITFVYKNEAKNK